MESNRQRLRQIIGAVDERLPVPEMEYLASTAKPALIAKAGRYRVYAVRWPVFAGVHGEGLLLQPRKTPRARLVVLGDADHTPEMLVGLAQGLPPASQFARRLAEAGCQVILPTLVDRKSTWSGNPAIVMTDQSHREWVFRQAYEMGRHDHRL